MKIPFFDMEARHASMKPQFLHAIGEVIDSGNFSGGQFIEQFETDFAAYCGVRNVVGVGNGTEALWLTLLAMGIGPGDEVVTVPMTFAATVEAICQSGAKPVFVDIDENTYTMSPEALEKALTPRTKAVIPVHLFGQVADMAPILEIARNHGLCVVEDAAQAHGAEYLGGKAGALGDAGCFSFYPTKNLGAFGEAGAISTNDDDLAKHLRILRNHGQSQKNFHSVIGWNSRLDAVQAVILSAKLPHLHEENQIRRLHASRYQRGLLELPEIVNPVESEKGRHVYHIFAIQVPDRLSLIKEFQKGQIGYGVHYPIPVHLQPAYSGLGHKPGDFPTAERCAKRFISLPMFPELNSNQANFVIETVGNWANSR